MAVATTAATAVASVAAVMAVAATTAVAATAVAAATAATKAMAVIVAATAVVASVAAGGEAGINDNDTKKGVDLFSYNPPTCGSVLSELYSFLFCRNPFFCMVTIVLILPASNIVRKHILYLYGRSNRPYSYILCDLLSIKFISLKLHQKRLLELFLESRSNILSNNFPDFIMKKAPGGE